MKDKAKTKDFTDVAADTMLGDFMELVRQELKAQKRHWEMMSEDEQTDSLHRIEMSLRQAITKAVKIIASENRETTSATLEQVTFKDGAKAVLKLPKDSASAHALIEAQGKSVYLVFADPDQHMAGADNVQADPQQKNLEVGRTH